MKTRPTSFFLLIPLAAFFSPGRALAQDKVIDLTEVDFNQPDLYPLTEEWEFYWNQLLTPADFDNGKTHESEIIKVPGGWNRQTDHPVLGFATYRIKIRLPANTNGLSIYFPVVSSAARYWINGKQIAESGRVSTDKERYTPKLTGTMLSLPPEETTIDLIVNVVNYSHFISGISGTPRLGKSSHLMNSLNSMQGIENFFAGSLIAMCIYQLILYFLYQRGRPYLWLSLICLGVALRALIVNGGSFLLPNLFPGVSWEIWKKIEFTSVYGITAFFPLYVYNLFPEHAPKWPIRFFVSISGLLCFAVMVTPQHIYGQLLEIDHVALLLTFIYAIYSVGKSWRKGSKDAKTIFWGVLASFPFILTEILKNSLLYPLEIRFMYLVEMGVLVFLVFQVYLLANHYANSYKNLASLNQNLEKIVVERTSQLVRANNVKDKLLSVVSHDIKSPLNSLRGILNIYNQGAINEEEFRHFSKKIEGDLSKTGLLVDNILYWTLSQLKGGQVKFEKLNLKTLVIENIELYRTIASNKSVTIRNELTQDHAIEFDRNILDLSIRNLISNAIKFSHEGGEVVIKCESTPEFTAIRVVDYGVGMSSEVVESLQSSQSTRSSAGTSNETGTGLGLSFCRDYLKMAGGELMIESVLKKGSVVSILIPAQVSGSR